MIVTDLARSGAPVVVDAAEVQLLAVGGDAGLHRTRRHRAVRRELPGEHCRYQHLQREISRVNTSRISNTGSSVLAVTMEHSAIANPPAKCGDYSNPSNKLYSSEYSTGPRSSPVTKKDYLLSTIGWVYLSRHDSLFKYFRG